MLANLLRASNRSSSHRTRLGLEVLEDRALMTAGALDPTFSTDGIVNTGSSALQEAAAVAIQPDGKIVVVGWTTNANGDKDFRAVRYNADGSLDNGNAGDSTPGDKFGSVGAVDIAFDFGGTKDDIAHAVAIQADGKIVIAGEAARNNNDVDFAVVRLNSDGSLDDGGANDSTPGDHFGNAGKTFVAFDKGGSNVDFANAVAITPDGKILLGGSAQWGTLDYDFAIARLNSDGSLDDGGANDSTPGDVFGTTGKVTIGFDLPNGIKADFLKAMALQPDGKIVLAGSANVAAGDTAMAVSRLNSDGSLDNGGVNDSTPGDAFGTNGRQTVDFGSQFDSAEAVALQSDGKIVLAGYHQISGTDYDFAVARLNTDGSLDDGTAGDSTPGDAFNAVGKKTIAFDLGNGNNADTASGVAIQKDGKIVVTGTVQRASAGDYDFGAARLTTDGTLDTTFSSDGKAVVFFDLGGSKADQAAGMALQQDGKIVVVGAVEKAAGDTDFGVARLENDVLSFDAKSYTGAEGASVTVTINRTAGSSGQVTVDLILVPQTATPGSDYVVPPQKVTFASGEVQKTVTIQLTADVYAEGNETFLVKLANPTGADIQGGTERVVTILDNATPPAQDVSAVVQVQQGKAKYNARKKRYRQLVTLTNVGTAPIYGPLALVISGLTKKTKLSNAESYTKSFSPVGSPYKVVPLGGQLPPGASMTAVLVFKTPGKTKLVYQSHVYAGVGIV